MEQLQNLNCFLKTSLLIVSTTQTKFEVMNSSKVTPTALFLLMLTRLFIQQPMLLLIWLAKLFSIKKLLKSFNTVSEG